MKKYLNVTLVIFLTFLLGACDSNKSKLKEFAKEFVRAVNTGDRLNIIELYPQIKNHPDLVLVDSISIDKIEVEFEPSDSTYKINLNKKQSLITKIGDNQNIIIIDSYKVLNLDSLTCELAIKTSAPINKFSDLENGELMNSEGSFVNFLQKNNPGVMDANLYHANGRIIWQGGINQFVKFDIPITNIGTTPVKSEDYSVEIIYRDKFNDRRVGTSVEYGSDLSPSETYVITTYKNELYNVALRQDLSVIVKFKLKDQILTHSLAKYGSFDGNEYNNWEELIKQSE